MEALQEVKQLIVDAKNICIIPSEENESESVLNALALFYTLKELNKNVNLIIEDFPEKFSFLIPSLDFINSPKNFIISIPRSEADVSQVYYEKNEDNLKIHLTIDKGRIKKENISFYFSDAKPDLVITLGVKDFQKQLSNKLDSFGFLLDSPILNIDNEEPFVSEHSTELSRSPQGENKKFGKINLIKNSSLSEIVLDIVKSIDLPAQAGENLIDKNVATCLLTGLITYYENFKSAKTNSQIFEIAAELIKKGASNEEVINNLYKTTEQETNFLGHIFQNLKMDGSKLSYALLNSKEFQNFTETQIEASLEKIKTIGIQNDLLVLWKSHASGPMIKGFFHSKKIDSVSKIAQIQPFDLAQGKQSSSKNDWVFISMSDSDINLAKDKILKIYSRPTA